jgi:hypothetical protein
MAHLIILQEATLRNYMEAFRQKTECSPVEILCNRIDGISALLRQQNAIGDDAKSGSGGNDQWAEPFPDKFSLVSSRIGKNTLPAVCAAGATDVLKPIASRRQTRGWYCIFRS